MGYILGQKILLTSTSQRSIPKDSIIDFEQLTKNFESDEIQFRKSCQPVVENISSVPPTEKYKG